MNDQYVSQDNDTGSNLGRSLEAQKSLVPSSDPDWILHNYNSTFGNVQMELLNTKNRTEGKCVYI